MIVKPSKKPGTYLPQGGNAIGLVIGLVVILVVIALKIRF